MFSNGTEYSIFMAEYCYRCSKYKSDKVDIPYKNSCKIEKKISEAMFEPDSFPSSNVYHVKGRGYICNQFKDKEEFKRKQSVKRMKPSENQTSFI